MTETLYIYREWTEGYSAYTREFTMDELLKLEELLDLEGLSGNGDDFTGFITGLNCDSYTDKGCDIMKYYYEGDIEECYKSSMEDEEFLTCYTVYRLWNTQLTEEEAKENWKESCICTLEGMVENMDT